jgi:hypothetical protein
MQPYLADYKNFQDTFNRPLYEIKIILFYISIIVPQSTEKGFKAQEYHQEGLLREKDGTRPDNTTGSSKYIQDYIAQACRVNKSESQEKGPGLYAKK